MHYLEDISRINKDKMLVHLETQRMQLLQLVQKLKVLKLHQQLKSSNKDWSAQILHYLFQQLILQVKKVPNTIPMATNV